MIAPYEHHEPETVAEALALLAEHGDDALVMAGGTALTLLLKQGLVRPAHVVCLRRVKELRGIAKTAEGGLRIGATATHREAERSREVAAYAAALAAAFAKVATVRIREQGTVGGNIAHADPAQDPPPILMALDASVTVARRDGSRSVPLDGFFTDLFQTTLAPDELITEVTLPALPRGTRATYVKFLPRTADDYATVSVGARVTLDVRGIVVGARVALGSVGATPLRARAVEDALRGAPLGEARIGEAAALVRDEVAPLDDARGSAAYKREMARVWTVRALRQLAA